MAIRPFAFVRHVNPGSAISDFREVFRDAGPNRWRFALAAAVATTAILALIPTKTWKKERALPTVTYITSWPADRTAAETRAFIAENQKRKEQDARLAEERAALEQQLWMAVGRASGVDVDRMKRQADADKAAEAAARKTRSEEILKRSEQAKVAH